MNVGNAAVEIAATADMLAESAAYRFVAAAASAIRARGEFIVAFSGGSTPRATYAVLASAPHARRVDWARVQVVWGDERCVRVDDAASNYGMARDALLDRVGIPEKNVHRLRGEIDPHEGAVDYEQELRRVLRTPVGPPLRESGKRIDLVLLGLGDDGHTASLFPGASQTHDSERWVEPAQAPAAPIDRVTLTPRVFNAAAAVLFLVAGKSKSGVLRRVLEGPLMPHELPAQLIAPLEGSVAWLVDSEAASELGA